MLRRNIILILSPIVQYHKQRMGFIIYFYITNGGSMFACNVRSFKTVFVQTENCLCVGSCMYKKRQCPNQRPIQNQKTSQNM